MSNLLFDHPELWTDRQGISPPAAWDGTKYTFLTGTFVDFTGTSTAGDVIAGTATWINDPSNTGSVASIADQVAPYNQYLLAGSTDTSPMSFSGDVATGTTSIEVQIFGNSSGYTGSVVLEAPSAPPPPPVIPSCVELGRVTRIYASGYERARVHDGRMVRGESRCLVVEFNGAIPLARTVASVTWRCVDPSVVVMSNARIQPGARSVAIDVRANWPSDTLIKCEATLDNGEVYAQLIHLSVTDSWWFGDETAASGPMVLTA